MGSIDIQYIKNKLSKYGLSFANFQELTGNLVGKVIVPSALRAFNKDLTAEEAFYFITNKVFELANVLAMSIPSRIGDVWERTVSYDDYKDFQKAIYEEVNQRFLSNAFPEFQNAGSSAIGNTQIQQGYIGGQLLQDWVNPLSRQIIANINWLQYEEAADVERDKIYMYQNCANALLPTDTKKRVMLACEDGSIGLVDQAAFATSQKANEMQEQVNKNQSEHTANKTEINKIKEEIKKFATKDLVEKIAIAFPKTERWDPDKTYQIPAFVTHDGGIYWNLINDNINSVPGGITGEGKWMKVTDIFTTSNVTDIIYAAATDFKKANANPNPLFYVSIQEILGIDNLNVDTLFSYLDAQFPHLNLTSDDVNKFYKNLCQSNPDTLRSSFTEFQQDQIIPFDDIASLNKFVSSNNLTSDQCEIIQQRKYIKIGNTESVSDKEGGLKTWTHYLNSDETPSGLDKIEWFITKSPGYKKAWYGKTYRFTLPLPESFNSFDDIVSYELDTSITKNEYFIWNVQVDKLNRVVNLDTKNTCNDNDYAENIKKLTLYYQIRGN